MENMEYNISTIAINLLFSLLIILSSSYFVICTSFLDYPSAKASTTWINHPASTNGTWRFSDSTSFTPILVLGKSGYPDFALGFLNNGSLSIYYYLVIVKLPNKVDFSTFSRYNSPSIILWSANGDNPVRENATLELNEDELLLKDVDGNLVWSANTSRPSISRLELFPNGNLKLINGSNGVIWQSFDNPTDTWLPGMSLPMRQRVSSSTSRYNLARGLFYYRPLNGAIRAFVGRFPGELQQYRYIFEFEKTDYFGFGIGSFYLSGNYVTYQSQTRDFQYIRLEPNGHLNVFQFVGGFKETMIADLFASKIYGECAYPTVCGKFGVCKYNSSCHCPGENRGDVTNDLFFKPLDAAQEYTGCSEVNQLKCEDSNLHSFLELPNVTYFRFNSTGWSNVSADQCKAACLGNCSCKAVVFRYRDDISVGGCYFPREIYSLMDISSSKVDLNYNAITYLKVQMSKSEEKKNKSLVSILSIVAGLAFSIFLATYCYIVLKGRVRKTSSGVMEEQIPSMYAASLVRKFYYDSLQAATNDFAVKIGSGGFGSVYQGILSDGTTKIAVKLLNHHGTKDFEAEVKTIGRVHHVNLVKLIGYCSEASKKLLVYEFMVNGSLDKWIFNKNLAQSLGWDTRRNIIIGIAKGLEYLHVHCDPHIIHFDIKPQNILLDDDFTVKIADFGLAKFIDKDQTHTSHLPKGTPGYMAPELIRSRNISVLVDVYSFGMVVLEITCGRRHGDNSDGEFLIDAVKKKATEGKLGDLIDCCEDDLTSYKEEILKTMELAICCLQNHLVRPSISSVVKILEGFLDMEPLTDYNFLGKYYIEPALCVDRSLTAPLASLLSGPR